MDDNIVTPFATVTVKHTPVKQHTNFQSTMQISDITNYLSSDVSQSSVCQDSDSSLEIFQDHLRCWAIGHHIAQNAVTDLLKIIKSDLKLSSLPSDAQTIFKTENCSNKIINLPPGKYYHFGLKAKLLLKLIQDNDINSGNFKIDEINLSINFDGLPLTKSSNSQFWPILVKIDELKKVEPFPIGVYHGERKPDNCNIFLRNFVDEMKLLQKEGLHVGNRILPVKINKILCDAPAKSFVLCIKNFNAYHSCTKCWAERLFTKNRMTFPELHSKLRTNEEFYSKADEDFHKETSVLCELNIDFITSVPLDYMHLILLGITKRVLGFLIKGNHEVRLSKENIDDINKKLKLVYKSIPHEFSRKPRLITEYDKWKATEFRSFLLYYGPWLMKPFLKSEYFLHFLSLHCAIRILMCDNLIKKYINYAHELLVYFVTHFGDLYGDEFMNHNVHNLIHLTLDVKNFGSLNKFSCFPFENYMHQIKMMLKTCNKPLSQFINRVNEYDKYASQKVEKKVFRKSNGYVFMYNKQVERFTAIEYKDFRIETKEPNCNFILKNNTIVKVIDIFQMNNTFYIKYKKCFLTPYFDNPMDSTIFYCGLSQVTEEEYVATADEILQKAFQIENCFLSIIHTD